MLCDVHVDSVCVFMIKDIAGICCYNVLNGLVSVDR